MQIIQTEIHAARLGDIAIATNEFELFTDYGIRIQARSLALQTFVVQLAVGYYLNLPTEIAVKVEDIVRSFKVALLDRRVELYSLTDLVN